MFDFKDVKGFIFDLDGTLIDSLGIWAQIDRAFFEKRGLELPEDYALAIFGMSFTEGARYTKERFGLPDSVAQIVQEWRDMSVEQYAHHIDCMPGAKEFVKLLRSQGKLLALATASGRELYEPVLRRHGLYECFDAFTTLDEVNRGKEFPDIYLLAAKKLGLRPEQCAVFEDLPAGIASAKSCGMKTVWVCSPGREQADIAADAAISDFIGLSAQHEQPR